MIREARKWVRNKKLAKKFNKAFRPLTTNTSSGTPGKADPIRTDRNINIEILGAGFKNKGAHLMLIAVVEKLSTSFPGARLAIRTKMKKNWDLGELKLYQKPSESESLTGELLIRLFSGKRTRKSNNIVLDSETDIVLDISGFQYSDRFGHRTIANRAKLIRRWKRSGKKVFLMPQAFGPFEAPRVRRAIRTIADHADLLFPRDQDSLDYLEQLVGSRDNIIMYPDFTNLVKGKVPGHYTVGKPRACLIPNAQMIAKTSQAIGELYVPFFASCANFLKAADLDPFILLHEIEKDGPLAREVQKLSSLSLDIVEERDPVHIKGIIGSCHLVVGSRFHALVSALSQGVPAVATSWSHKYERLYQEYGCQELLISNLDFEEQALEVMHALTDREKYDGMVLTLKESGRLQRQRTEQMWKKVIEAMDPDNGIIR
jgi:colanic acid/amylovoran biosynthesis protein